MPREELTGSRQSVFAHGVRARQVTHDSFDTLISKLYINTGNFGLTPAGLDGLSVDIQDIFFLTFARPLGLYRTWIETSHWINWYSFQINSLRAPTGA